MQRAVAVLVALAVAAAAVATADAGAGPPAQQPAQAWEDNDLVFEESARRREAAAAAAAAAASASTRVPAAGTAGAAGEAPPPDDDLEALAAPDAFLSDTGADAAQKEEQDLVFPALSASPADEEEEEVAEETEAKAEGAGAEPEAAGGGGGLLATLSGLGARARRSLLEGLGGLARWAAPAAPRADGASRKRRSADEDEDLENELEQQSEDAGAKPADDEDYQDDGVSGSGTFGQAPSDQPRYFRIMLTLEEPFSPALENRGSPEFAALEETLRTAVERLFREDEGLRRHAAVIKFSPLDGDRMKTEAVLDLGVLGSLPDDAVRERLENHVRRYRALDKIVVSDRVIVRPFGAGQRPPQTTPSSACDVFELRCQSGECLPQDTRCNGRVDCRDGSDEIGCPTRSAVRPPARWPTPPRPLRDDDDDVVTEAGALPTGERHGCRADDQVRCPDGSTYICSSQRCDGKEDCQDGWDEQDCGEVPVRCGVNEYACDLVRCISVAQRCNGRKDCTDGTDEQGCPGTSPRPTPKECVGDQFRCDDGSACVEKFQRCNRVPDCADFSDEYDCPSDGEDGSKNCQRGEYSCKDNTCIPLSQRCDGKVNCRERDDEENCLCSPYQWQCNDGTCLPGEKRCNEKRDCPFDDSDEKDCSIRNCTAGEFQCKTGKCIPLSKFCNFKYDCGPDDQSDEFDCPCTDEHFRCDNGVCIPKKNKCDRYNDCQDGSDEKNCHVCRPDEFKCDDDTCISYFLRCNNQRDCHDGSDEFNCTVSCRSDQFSCLDGRCLSIYQRCDGVEQCLDGEDELGCATCGDREWRCNDGQCIYIMDRCNGQYECEDRSDEKDCEPVAPCPNSDFTCQDYSCIPLSSRCDGRTDCPYGEDEQNCDICGEGFFPCLNKQCVPIAKKCDKKEGCKELRAACSKADTHKCAVNEFTCNNGMCIPGHQRCNDIHECEDGSDEAKCDRGCRQDEFTCRNGECVTISYRCDGTSDCTDNSDEIDCSSFTPSPGTCSPSEFMCDDGRCLSLSFRCNSVIDCDDSSDEYNCDSSCEPGQFRCNDSACIPESRRCDNYRDCSDDELNCGPPTCSSLDYQCVSGDCIRLDQRCDRRIDCRDGSDEAGCENSRNCLLTEFECGDGTCIDENRHCDRLYDCQDFSDEQDCLDCRPNEFRCLDGQCVPLSAKCNRRYDCPDGSDELQCEPLTTLRPLPPSPCRPGEFQCTRSGECISSAAVCNKRYDCQDSSDEANCAGRGSCSVYEFRCENGPCIPSNKRCNRHIDCPRDSSDELDCNPKEGLNLKTYPDEQIIKEVHEGREVVFQCRDEGPRRVRVHWIRGNGLPLPPGSRDFNGRLEMPEIQLDHSGTYICEAIGVPPDTPGQRVSVHLTVEPSGRIIITPSQPSSRSRSESPSLLKYGVLSYSEYDYYGPVPSLPVRPPEACAVHEATCSNGECISKTLVCDGNFDCSDGSDEMRCSFGGCEPNEFRCSNKKCVLKTWRCDGDDDCGDHSDEDNCATNPPGSPCRYNEFQCRTGNQCIPRSFHCDQQNDCQDGSDEFGCSPVYIQSPPPPMVVLDQGAVFTITCKALGVPTPEVVWRLNWGHVPAKCRMESVGGEGKLTCPDIQPQDQGAYSCEAINTRGSVFAVPDSILVVNRPRTVCQQGYFNDLATSVRECISCFCFGISTDCKSADLFTYQLPPPVQDYRLVSVSLDADRNIDIQPSSPFRTSPIRAQTQTGFQLYHQSGYERLAPDQYVYFALPENYLGNQLKSYGGYVKYSVRPEGNGPLIRIPDVILSGNGYTLAYYANNIAVGSENNVSAQLFYGQWYKRTRTRRPGGDITPSSSSEDLASREEIMMALGNVDNILIRGQYVSGPYLDVTFSNIGMDSAGIRNTGQGQASYVEECRCPAGYMGLSCEQCAPGYHRHQSGPWLGLCTREAIQCPSGQYGDPSRGVPCRDCPCPSTSASNRYGLTCQLGGDGDVTCNCPPGYTGRRCEYCDVGYEGNPLVPNRPCRPADVCDPAGSLQPRPDSTGQCRCKDYTVGAKCNQCAEKSFHLDAKNKDGCIPCFCMGISDQCTSSNWYRQQVTSSFIRSTNDFHLVESQDRDKSIVDGIRLNAENREIIYSDFSWRSNNVYYWSLPIQFLGDKITSYGGTLKYTIRYVPAPGGLSSRNNAPDVELISINDIHLMHFSQEQISPERSQTVSVPLLEQYWQRQDGQRADREHLLMTLADLEAILIKATYTTNTREAAISQVTLDIAEERNTGQSRALEVEQCSCQVGYRGLSCQDCDVGYTRTDGGLYLGFCEPCSCNGFSEDCDPETGICTNCRDNTAGPHCEECAEGYDKDPRDNVCRPASVPGPTCRCDARGARQQGCPDGRSCVCKTNVEGLQCDRCRRGTFDLSSSHPEGCLSCWCSGITDQCISSRLQRTQIPMQLIGEAHGFTLVDSERNPIVRSGFNENVAENELGYQFQGRDQRLFWSLPSQFTGNKLASYGGNLTVTQRYTARPGSQWRHDTDILIFGSGISIYWSGNDDMRPNVPTTYSVPLQEQQWRRLVATGPRTASRSDLLTVLSNIEAILIRAEMASLTLETFISDVSLDTAVDQTTGQGIVSSIEICRCPQGYRGYSCESCSVGYYRRTLSDGRASCEKCPCNGNEESCSISPSGDVVCRCIPGFTGRYCDNPDGVAPTTRSPIDYTPSTPTITVSILGPAIQIVEAGSTVRFRCSGQSVRQVPVKVSWSKESGQLPQGRAIDDGRGILIITRVEPPDSGVYVCSVDDGYEVASQRATLNVGGTTPQEPPRVEVSPPVSTVSDGEVAEFVCRATGYPEPTVTWARSDGRPLGPHAQYSGGVLRIRPARVNDAGEFICHAWSPTGNTSRRGVLYVRERPGSPEVPLIEPVEYTGPEDQTVRLQCRGPSSDSTLTWTRARGAPLPAGARSQDGALLLYSPRPSDSGIYVCQASRPGFPRTSAEARVNIVAGSVDSPVVRIQPERQTVPQGSVVELKCVTPGATSATVSWTRARDSLPSGAIPTGPTLRLPNVSVRDRGVYVCTVTTPGRPSAQASAVLEVEPRERPTVDLYPGPQQTIVAGGSALLQCRITGGVPTPTVRWSRSDGRPLSPAIERLDGGVLRFVGVSQSDEGQYICTAENSAGVATISAELDVQEIPRITLTPSSPVSAIEGQSVRLECQASGDPPPLLTWLRHKPGSNFYEPQRITAEQKQKAVFEITRVTKLDEGSYTCQATNAAGSMEERLLLTVEEANSVLPEPGNAERPYPQPQPQPGDLGVYTKDVFTVLENGNAEMRCLLKSANPGVFLSWSRRDGRPLPINSYQRDGFLVIQRVQKSDEGEYSCLGYEDGSVLFQANARLQVIALPEVHIEPKRQTVHPGDFANITCSSSGSSPVRIEWITPERADSSSVVIRDGLLQFRGIRVTDAGDYVCRVTSPQGSAESTAQVIVEPSRPSTAQKQTIAAGNSIELRCSVPPGANVRSFTWSYPTGRAPQNAEEHGEVLILRNVRPSDQGRYSCTVSGPGGSFTNYIDLSVRRWGGCSESGSVPCLHSNQCVPTSAWCDGRPDCDDRSDEEECPTRRERGLQNLALRIDPSHEKVRPGDNLDLRCMARGDPLVTYQWSRAGGSLANNVQVSGELLRIQDVRIENGGVYRCTVTADSGQYFKDYVLTLQGLHDDTEDRPVVETRSAPYGSTVTMDCKIDLESPVSYSWSKMNGDLPSDINSQGAILRLKDITAQDAGTYVCSARNDRVELNIPTVLVVTGIVPHFTQSPNSYMEFRPLSNVYTSFSITVSFKPEEENGLILYSGQHSNGTGDFISLGLNNSFVEFRFNVGSGPAVIRSQRPVTLNKWHTARMDRDRKTGTLEVDEQPIVRGESPGGFVGLDLEQSLFVGSVPDFSAISRLAGHRQGFVGCISQLVIGEKNIDLVHEAKASHYIMMCDTCEGHPCKNNGVCQEAAEPEGYSCICPPGFGGQDCDRVGEACYPGVCNTGRCVNLDESFLCYCPLNKTGERCEREIDIRQLRFGENSYIAYPTPTKPIRQFGIEMKIKPESYEDGLLAYCAHDENGRRDFISLSILNRRVEFRFDTGSGPAIMRSTREIVPGQWMTVVARRLARQGQVSVDGETPVRGYSPGTTGGLNLQTLLFIGGVDPQRVNVAPGASVSAPFQGCISDVKVGGVFLDLLGGSVDAGNIRDCPNGSQMTTHSQNTKCSHHPCQNGGTCIIDDEDNYSCVCQEGFRGRHCEKKADMCEILQPCRNGGTCINKVGTYYCRCLMGFTGTDCEHSVTFTTEAGFRGDGYLELRNSLLPHRNADEKETIIVEFTTNDQNGLIFWHGQHPETDGKGQDYLVLAVVNGYLQFGYELGSGPALITAHKKNVADGQRHRVVLKREATVGSLELDEEIEFGTSQGVLQMLNTRGNIYIGGGPNLELMTAGNYTHGFTGCLHLLEIQDSGIINLKETALYGVNVTPCPRHASEADNEITPRIH